MSKLLVTGATGFIGQYVVRDLVARGHAVVASSAHAARAAKADWFSRVRYVPFDLAAFDPATDYFAFFGRPDRMIHLAWEGLPNYKNDFHVEENYPRHAALLENMVRGGLKDLTVVGTCLEYGMQEGALDEAMPASPGNPYAIAKDRLRRRLEELATQYPYLLRWVRLFYIYGEGQNPKSLFSQLDEALKKGEQVFNMSGGRQVRDFLPIEKVADHLIRIATQDRVTGIINCCSGRPVSVLEFVEEFLRRNGKRISLNLGYYPYPDYEPMRFWGNDAKLKTILNDE